MSNRASKAGGAAPEVEGTAEDRSFGQEVDRLLELNEALTEEAEGLRTQVKRLVRTEGKLYKIQEQLDLQVKIFRQLYQLGQKVNATFSVDTIVKHIPEFVLYELGYQRALVFIREPSESVFRARAWDGYYDEESAAALQRVEIADDHPLVGVVRASGQALHTDSEPNEALAAASAPLLMDRFIVYPLYSQDVLVGLLAAGNTLEEAEYYVRVESESDSAYGLANLAGQVAAAIHSAFLYRALAEERNQLEAKVRDRTVELSDAYRDLEKLTEQKSQFFANVSHELRTPLTLCLGPLEQLLNADAQLDPQARKRHLEMVHQNQLRLLKLINDLLDFAKIDAGRMSLALRPERVVRMLRYYVSTISGAAQSRGMQVRFESNVEESTLYLDGDKFEKIIMNLLSNAFKFTPNGGSIAVTATELDGTVVIEVTDSGVGMPKEALPTIFERFSQVDGSEKRHYAGTGIGLAMVQEYVLMHGGTVVVDSEVGQGTTFRLTFPRGCAHADPGAIVSHEVATEETVSATSVVEFTVDNAQDELDSAAIEAELDVVEPTDESPEVTPRPTGATASAEEQATVLVVDDVPDMRRFIRQVLSEEHRVITARDGREGFEKAKRYHPTIIVSDVMMPHMTGFELLDAIRKSPGSLSRTPVILVSARADLDKRIEGLSHGANDYLYKPFNATEMLTRVRNLVRLRRQEQELALALSRLEERDARMTDDLLQARDFQQSILPAAVDVPGFDVEIGYHPTDLVGGDYYDLIVEDALDAAAGEGATPRRARVFVADATGHGIKASLATMFIKIEYDRAKHVPGGPDAVMQALNDSISGKYGALSLRFTAICADIDLDTGRVSYCTAAHPGPVFVNAEGATELDTAGTFVGLMPGIAFPSFECEIGPGEVLFLYTDGVTEEWSDAEGEYDVDRMLESLARNYRAGNGLSDALYQEVLAFGTSGEHLGDDATCIAIRRRA